MKTRCNVRNRIGLAVLAALFLAPVFARAAGKCLNVRPSFTYTPVVLAGGESALGITAQAGCFWEVLSQPEWIKIVSLDRGYGSGLVVFRILPNKTEAPAEGLLRLAVRDLNSRRSSTVDLPIRTIGNPSGIVARAIIPR